MKRQSLIFTMIFGVLGLIALQIPFTRLLGANVRFTFFDFVAPTVGVFIGMPIGILTVLFIQLVNILLRGGYIPDIGSIIRLFPTLFAVAYFAYNSASSRSKLSSSSGRDILSFVVPILAIVAFNLHTIGRSAWQYSLLWLIPIGASFFRKNLFTRSLGATFTAHAVGGAAWVWAFGLSKQIWLALIPQVIMERLVMAAGISAFYLVFTYILNFASIRKLTTYKLSTKNKTLSS